MLPSQDQVLEYWNRLVAVAQSLSDSIGATQIWLNESFLYMKTLLSDASTRHYAWGALLITIFWPLLVTLLMALSAASTWLFWLLTSIIFGSIQLVYVSYQFCMILCDILLLSTLKTYSYIWRTFFGNLTKKKSRRRMWKSLLDGANSYKSYCELQIDPKEDVVPDRRFSTAYAKQSTSSTQSKLFGVPQSPHVRESHWISEK